MHQSTKNKQPPRIIVYFDYFVVTNHTIFTFKLKMYERRIMK